MDIKIRLYNDLLEELNSADPWIKCSERLPDIGFDPDYMFASKFILLSDGEHTYYGQYESLEVDGSGDFIDENGDSFADDGVIITHWTPLPEPPKK